MSKFKPGDKVIIRLKAGTTPPPYSGLSRFEGETVILDQIHTPMIPTSSPAWVLKPSNGFYFLEEHLVPLDDIKVSSSKKTYTDNCPCGIHYSRCDYHKE